jgi:hypothetical protein
MGRRGASAQSGVRFRTGSLRGRVAIPHQSVESRCREATWVGLLLRDAEVAVQVSIEP